MNARVATGRRRQPELSRLADALAAELSPLRFAEPITHVYNPRVYARACYTQYIERWGTARPREVLLLGMNPGPFGMVQTGVPFGEVAMVRDFVGVCGEVERPRREHHKRPVTGFACTRSEVSGARLWGWARQRFGTAERFFARFFVYNYCPLAFMEESGRNFTPDKLPRAEREALYAACDRALLGAVQYLSPRVVVGVGAFAEERARAALAGVDVTIGRILHPSPASPLANRGWAAGVEEGLLALGVSLG